MLNQTYIFLYCNKSRPSGVRQRADGVSIGLSEYIHFWMFKLIDVYLLCLYASSLLCGLIGYASENNCLMKVVIVVVRAQVHNEFAIS